MKMNSYRAQELIIPLKNGTANDISPAWAERLIEALEYVIEHEAAQPNMQAGAVDACVKCGCGRHNHPDWLCNANYQRR